MKFTDLTVQPELMAGIQDMGFENLTPVQEQSIPLILDGKDIIASAKTGTGKTAAFVLPILERILSQKKSGIRALILAPTRELATQITENIWGLGYHTSISTASIIGGADYDDQARALNNNPNIIVATPGRLIDQMNLLKLDFSTVEYLVLDEADRMLDMGFIPSVLQILATLPEKRQNLLFSATIPPKIVKLTERMMKDPVRVNVATFQTADSIEQVYYLVPEVLKTDLLENLLKENNWNSSIVFLATKRGTEKLARSLQKRGIRANAIHGDRTQDEREAALNEFKSGVSNVLVATDVIARGIDIDAVSHIVNYDVPNDVEDYIHRIGRTGRADLKGNAVTLVAKGEMSFLETIKNTVQVEIVKNELPEAILQKVSEMGLTSHVVFDPNAEVGEDDWTGNPNPNRNNRFGRHQRPGQHRGGERRDHKTGKPHHPKGPRPQGDKKPQPANAQVEPIQVATVTTDAPKTSAPVREQKVQRPQHPPRPQNQGPRPPRPQQNQQNQPKAEATGQVVTNPQQPRQGQDNRHPRPQHSRNAQQNRPGQPQGNKKGVPPPQKRKEKPLVGTQTKLRPKPSTGVIGFLKKLFTGKS